MTRRGLQLFLTVLGAIALVMGVVGVVTGGAGVLDGGHVSPNVDSEIRFFAAWYAGAGVLLLRVRHRVETETTLIRGVCAVLVRDDAIDGITARYGDSTRPGFP